ncbi:MAG: MucB/RseB C-terminal domain-containing protein [Pseudomonadota bacterium]
MSASPGCGRAAVALPWLGVLALVALLPVTACAGETDARGWLERMRNAATSGTYQGTMVFSAGGSMSSTRVWHYCVGDQTFERLEAQDGRHQRVFRHNEEVRTVWPQDRVAVVEKREPLAGWGTTPQQVEPSALENYELRAEGSARVAGRDAAVFLLEPRDGLRFAQRLWADRGTGLMLRADVLGPAPAGASRPVLETAAFSEIEIGVRPQPEAVLQAIRRIDAAAARLDAQETARSGSARAEPPGRSGPAASLRAPGRPEASSALRAEPAPADERAEVWHVVRPPQRRADLEAEGWTLRQQVPGFRLAGCVVRGIESAGQPVSVLQAVFSDGLTHVSLFVEPYRSDRHRSEMQAQFGAAHTVMRRLGEHWVTVIGDVPAATLKLFADALERRR